jgi:hypothetical protein
LNYLQEFEGGHSFQGNRFNTKESLLIMSFESASRFQAFSELVFLKHLQVRDEPATKSNKKLHQTITSV